MKKVFLILTVVSFLGCKSPENTSENNTSDTTKVIDSVKVDTTIVVKDTTK